MKSNPELLGPANFAGKLILVTGGTKGIGEAIVLRLIRGGGKVITTGRSLPPDASSDKFVQSDVSTRQGITYLRD